MQRAKKLAETIGPPISYDFPLPVAAYSLVAVEAKKLAESRKYADFKRDLDLLFYITRQHASQVLPEEIDRKFLAALGWRSISCLGGPQAIVLFANADAPKFLRDGV
jgi:hypothetical protein